MLTLLVNFSLWITVRLWLGVFPLSVLTDPTLVLGRAQRLCLSGHVLIIANHKHFSVLKMEVYFLLRLSAHWRVGPWDFVPWPHQSWSSIFILYIFAFEVFTGEHFTRYYITVWWRLSFLQPLSQRHLGGHAIPSAGSIFKTILIAYIAASIGAPNGHLKCKPAEYNLRKTRR